MTDTTKHSPGPWTVCTSVSGYRTICGDNYNSIAVVTQSSKVDHEANAKLIAAAPELLAALETIYYSCEEDIDHRPEINLLWLGALLIKARGVNLPDLRK